MSKGIGPTTNDRARLCAVLAADDGYALPLVVTLGSLLRNATRPLNVAVCDAGLSPRTKRVVDRLVLEAGCGDTVWIDGLTLTSAQRKTPRHQSAATYARLELPEHLVEHPTLVYLDSDLLVVGDVTELNAPQDLAVAAVADCSMPTFAAAPHLSAYGLEPTTPYLSAGVLVINTRKWLESGVGERCFYFLDSAEKPLPYNDQDALSLALNGNWQELEGRWNVHLGAIYSNAETRAATAESRAGGAILHFTGRRKPWHATAPYRERRAWLLAALRACSPPNGLGVAGLHWLASQMLRSAYERITHRLRGGG